MTRIDLGQNTEGYDNGDKKLEFVYDYMGRRVEKKYSVYASGNWVVQTGGWQRFVYDNWNVVMVLNGLSDPPNATLKKYTWGLDLSGLGGSYTSAGIHGAGGIGGLLACEEPQGEGDPKKYWFLYDANGNVGQVLRYAAGSTPSVTRVAHYEYDPYGQVVTANNNVYEADGTLISTNNGYVVDNPFRFSTKWADALQSGSLLANNPLYYYGYRYYSPRLGRWINRDPIEERGGLNLDAFVHNRPTVARDPLGWQCYDVYCDPNNGFPVYIPKPSKNTCVNSCVSTFGTFLTGDGSTQTLGSDMWKKIQNLDGFHDLVQDIEAAVRGASPPCSSSPECARAFYGSTRLRPDGSGYMDLVIGVGGFDLSWLWLCQYSCGQGAMRSDGCCCKCEAQCRIAWRFTDRYTFDAPPPSCLDWDNNWPLREIFQLDHLGTSYDIVGRWNED